MVDLDRTGAPFNMALNTLEKIHKILIRIGEISTGASLAGEHNEMSWGQAQHIKYRLVKQLFIQSIPLLKAKKHDEWKSEMWKDILEVKLTYTKKLNHNKKIVGYGEAFSLALEIELDELTMEIEEKLQEEGYFMPPKTDPRFTWKQD